MQLQSEVALLCPAERLPRDAEEVSHPDPEKRGRAYIADKMYLNGTALPATHEPLFGADSESVSTIAVDTSIGREATEEEEYLDVFLTLPKRQSAAAQRGARVSKKRKRNRARTTCV